MLFSSILSDTSTLPPCQWSCSWCKGILQPVAFIYNQAGPSGCSNSAPPAGSSDVSAPPLLKYPRVISPSSVPAPPLPPPDSDVRLVVEIYWGSTEISLPQLIRKIRVKKYLLFTLHTFTIFILFLICCSLVDIKSFYVGLLDTRRPSRLFFFSSSHIRFR